MVDKNSGLGRQTDLRVTIHEVLRYGYGGFLVYLVAALVDPAGVKVVLESLGATVGALLAFALGAAIYSGYRPVVGELLFLAHEWVHGWISSKGKDYTCRSWYFRKTFGLSLPLATEAFRTVRDHPAFNQEKQRRFHLQHSELHTLYVSFVVLLAGACVLWIRGPGEALISGWVLFGAALFALLSGFVGDILLCRQECKTLLQVPESTIREILTTTRFI